MIRYWRGNKMKNVQMIRQRRDQRIVYMKQSDDDWYGTNTIWIRTITIFNWLGTDNNRMIQQCRDQRMITIMISNDNDNGVIRERYDREYWMNNVQTIYEVYANSIRKMKTKRLIETLMKLWNEMERNGIVSVHTITTMIRSENGKLTMISSSGINISAHR